MKVLILSVLVAGGVWGQQQYTTPTAVYPGAVVTDKQLKVMNNNGHTTLTLPMGTGDTSFHVNSCSAIPPNSLITMDTEIVAALSCTGGIVTVDTTSSGCTSGRACDGTSLAAHSANITIHRYFDAWDKNALSAEVIAIQTTLGPNLSNIQGTYLNSSVYNFSPQTPGGTLSAGSNTVSISPGIPGVAGTDINHWLYASGGSGTPGSCLITGGTATSGVAGTLILNCVSGTSLSGAWTLSSASGGIKEASLYCHITGQSGVRIPPLNTTVYALLDLSDGCSIRGTGMMTTYLNCQMLSRCVQWIGSNQNGANPDIGDFTINYPTPGTSQEGLYIQDVGTGNATNINILNSFDVVTLQSVAHLTVDTLMGGGQRNGINLRSSPTSTVTVSSYPIVNNVHLVLPPGVGTALNLGTELAGPIFTNMILERGSTCIAAIGSDGTPINEVFFQGICDSYADNGLQINVSAGTTANRWTINGSKFQGTTGTYGWLLQGSGANAITAFMGTGNTIGFSAVDGIRMEGVIGANITGNIIYGVVSNNTGQCVELNTTADANILIAGNILGAGLAGATTCATGVFIGAQNHSGISITNNQFYFGTAAVVDNHTGSGYVGWVKNSPGVDTVVPSIASGAALALPVNPNFTITGTTGVTSITGSCFAGRTGFITTTSGVVVFTIGASIGNTISTVANVPTGYYCDGSGKFWLGAGGGSGGGSSPTGYSATVTSLTTLTITSGTHGQGAIVNGYCYDTASPPNRVDCVAGVDGSGNVSFGWKPAFTGSVVVK